MRLFVYEYTCAVGAELPASLRAEGRAMLAAVVEDCNQIAGVEVETLIYPNCPATRDPVEEFTRRAARADYTLVIAPESGGILEARCRRVLEAGGRLLGPTPEAVALTADKLALGRHLSARGIATPAVTAGTWSASAAGWQFANPVDFPAVCKPRHGAGSQATFLVSQAADLARCAAVALQEGAAGEVVLQPFVAGIPVSVAFLAGPPQFFPLLPAAQHLSDDGRFRYLGGEVPLPPELAARALRLASAAVEAVRGLQGFFGVDLVLGAAGADHVIEINPRITTSYIGLRQLARFNLAEAMLRLLTGETPRELHWRPGRVQFRGDGSVC